MGTFIDLTGQHFGRLTVLERAEDQISKSGRHRVQWKCLCDCGKTVVVGGEQLREGRTRSCGCFRADCRRKREEVRKENQRYEFRDEYVIGFTEKGEAFYFDKEDYKKVSKIYWGINKSMGGYVMGSDNGKAVLLHRLVMNSKEREIIDHINHNPVDCRKCNLRKVTGSQNQMNRSGQKNNSSGRIGVTWYNRIGKWKVHICKNRKRYSLGYYQHFEDAVKAREEAEDRLFGEYSYKNSVNISPETVSA